ncbi:MAG TPA: transporter [Terriglobales bacterium]
MIKRALLTLAMSGLFTCMAATGQNICNNSADRTKLYCLMPTAFHTPAASFNFFNTAFATELSQLPLATPASGIIYEVVNGVLTESTKSFGPIMSERAETTGRHKLFLGFTYQHFLFNSIDGTDLKNVPIVFTFLTPGDEIFTATTNRISTTVNQYAAYATFGLTNRVDVSIAVPFQRVALGVSSTGTEYSTTSNAQASFQEYIPGVASGFGDVLLAAKGTAWRSERSAVAFGAELRLPSGDALNFLGSGAVGVKPYMAWSRKGRISPHANLGYQWNGSSVLAENSAGQNQQLPTHFLYYFGADMEATERLTVVADFLGQEFFNAPRVSSPVQVTIPNRGLSFPSVEPINGSYAANVLAIGAKVNPWNHLLITGNLSIRLSNGGLRANVVPLVGASYTF